MISEFDFVIITFEDTTLDGYASKFRSIHQILLIVSDVEK